MTFLSDSLVFLPQDFQLEAQAVYTRAGEKLVRQRQYGAVRQLLKCVGESGTATKNDCDALILRYISVADKAPANVSDEIILKIQAHSCKHTVTSFLFCFFYYPGQRTGQSHFGDQKHRKQGTSRLFTPA